MPSKLNWFCLPRFLFLEFFRSFALIDLHLLRLRSAVLIAWEMNETPRAWLALWRKRHPNPRRTTQHLHRSETPFLAGLERRSTTLPDEKRGPIRRCFEICL